MNQQEQTDNWLEEESTDLINQDYPQNSQENEIVYIAELNGEFFTVDYNNQSDNPTVTPLKVVKFMSPAEGQTANGQELSPASFLEKASDTDEDASSIMSSPSKSNQLVSLENKVDGELQSLETPAKPTLAKPSNRKQSGNKSVLAMGIGIGLLIALGGTRLFAARSGSDSANTVIPTELTPPQIRSVTVAKAQTSMVDRTIEVSGTVEALELIPVISEVAGLQIQQILVDEGTQVDRGQVLAELKNDTIEAEYIQAQAAVDGAQARLAELQAGTRSEEIARAQERVNRANAGVEQAQSDLELVSKRVERNRNLQVEGAISRDRLDEINNQERISRANLDQAEASLQEANQELKQLRTGERPEVISQAQAELARAKGQLKYASVQLDNTIIKAVTSGIIAERNAKVGDLTSSSQTMFTIIENGSLELRLQVAETDLGRIKPGQSVTITNNQNNAQSIIGKVREIDPIVNSDSRQAIVKVNLPSETNLQPGMFLEAAITTSQVPGTTLPIKAILPQTGDEAIAFVVDENNTVSARSVKMGEILTNNQIEVLAGLESGETVVVKGAAYLKDGDRISIINES
ncbi:RND family efflux transporter, MFP subunit (modular protein) [Hyella patelloides LEGE 07179]|uniref:RND family efflux transporter, MFP subunit (Modular protein) n=1 Tax=Hyella patelloides LEGE 07179 TaxID=945734 RepID=A0A563VSQ8_9CYAN|nr:efflux RND transporter periplasmic adaptor subunit [Hyella patelloides]VEP14412.1 RND family efflux transporter, MFP subunit (modular protein) [Hyella patelloides LEGE 07179]